MKTLEEGFKFVLEFFNHDYEKALMWFYIPNPALGGISAANMIMTDRTEKLLKFIEDKQEGFF